MKSKWKSLLTIFLVFFEMATVVVSSVAWFNDNAIVNVDNTLGYTASSYFKGGTGTSSDPYLIDQPVHLYNLAWLQYLGFFNKTTTSGGTTTYDQTQTYFKIDDNVTSLDMSGVVLPPIGTTNNPFIGVFNGNNKIISNLVVTNAIGSDSSSISIKPINVTASDFTGVNIVGMFGVVGDYNGEGKYSSITPIAKDFYLNNCTVNTQLTSTLIGLVAGYANGSISNVGIINSNLKIVSGSSAFNSTLTSNLSNYSTIGYATDAYKSSIVRSVKTFKDNTVSYPQDITTLTGSANKWGGSIDMQAMHTRLNYFLNNSTAQNMGVVSETDTYAVGATTPVVSNVVNSTDYFRTYSSSSNPLYGKFTFGLYQSSDYNSSTPSSQYIYLNGKRNFTKEVTNVRYANTTTNMAAYYIASATRSNGTKYYLNLNGTTITTSTTASTTWSFSDNNGSSGYIFTVINGTQYYLNCVSTSTVSLQTTASSIWTYSSSGTRISTTYNSTTYYLYGTSSTWGVRTGDTYYLYASSSGTTLTYTGFTSSTDTQTVANGTSTLDTYFPLNVVNDDSTKGTLDYNASDTNTGYVVSGANSNTTSSTFPYKVGDIRVSYYTLKTYLSTSLNSGSYSDSSLQTVTVNAKTSGNPVRILDTDISSSSTYNSSLPSTAMTVENLGYSKFVSSKTALKKLFNSSTNIYGLHFMEGAINKNNIVTADSVKINSSTPISSYELPQDSIDFNVQDKGFINFFAGTYFNNNNSFFSLHRVFRNSTTNAITDIKEIEYVYGPTNTNNDVDYIYKYKNDSNYYDNTNTYTSIPAAYSSTPLFNMTWITNPTIVNNSLYYFEIPCNAGEYALGSVSSTAIGAYLLYLDISANAQPLDRTEVTEYFSTASSSYEYPLGVGLVESSTSTVDPLNSIAASLSSTFNGTLNLVRATNNITLTRSNTSVNYTPTYIGKEISLYDGNDPNTKLTATSISGTNHTESVKRLTWIDYNEITGETTTTIMTETSIDGGTAVRTFSKVYTIVNSSTGHVVGASVDGATDDNSTINDVSGNATILELFYDHTNTATITFTINLTSQVDSSVTDKVLRLVTGYNLVPTSSQAITIKVTIKSATYVVTITRSATDVVTVDVNSSVDIVATP